MSQYKDKRVEYRALHGRRRHKQLKILFVKFVMGKAVKYLPSIQQGDCWGVTAVRRMCMYMYASLVMIHFFFFFTFFA